MGTGRPWMMSGRTEGTARGAARPASLAAVVLAGLLLAGCGSVLGGGPPPNIYTLSSKHTFDDDLPLIGVSQQLVVEPPGTAGGLNTNRIVVQPQHLQMDFYAGVRWSERAPLMVQSLLLDSFENTGKIISVGREALGLRPDFVLRGDMRAFHAQYFMRRGEPVEVPNVLVMLNVKLIQMPQERIVDSRSFDACVTATSAQIEDVIRAFDDALGGVMKDTVQWTLRRMHAKSTIGDLGQLRAMETLPERGECRPKK